MAIAIIVIKVSPEEYFTDYNESAIKVRVTIVIIKILGCGGAFEIIAIRSFTTSYPLKFNK